MKKMIIGAVCAICGLQFVQILLLLESMNGPLNFLGGSLIVIGVPAFVAGLTLWTKSKISSRRSHGVTGHKKVLL